MIVKSSPHAAMRWEHSGTRATPLLQSLLRRAASTAFALALAAACAGCGTRATIVLRDGRSIQGRIVEGSEDINVAENDELGEFAYLRRAISEIRHPGTAAMIVGAALLGLGGLLFTSSLVKECPEQKEWRLFDDCELGRAAGMFYGGAMGVTGIGVGSYGLGVNLASRERAGKPRARDPLEWDEPDPLHWENEMRGLRVTGRF